MTISKPLELGRSADGKLVTLDYANTNVEYHIIETPDLLNLVQEVLPTLILGDQAQIVAERDLGRVVGTTNLVGTTDKDEIVYAMRVGRSKYSRFVKRKSVIPCSSIVVVLRKGVDGYYLWTAMCGKLLPPEAYLSPSPYTEHTV